MKPESRFTRAAVFAVLLVGQGPVAGAASEVSIDPTRPPSASTNASGDDKPGHVRVVQSVLIAPGRTVAVVDGQTVRVGSRIGDARVMRIDETGVMLSQNGKTEILVLFPDARKSDPRRAGAGQRSNEARAK